MTASPPSNPGEGSESSAVASMPGMEDNAWESYDYGRAQTAKTSTALCNDASDWMTQRYDPTGSGGISALTQLSCPAENSTLAITEPVWVSIMIATRGGDGIGS